MSGLLFRTALSSSLILNRVQLISPRLLALNQQIKLQSTSASDTSLSSAIKLNPISFKQLYSTNKKNESAEAEGLEKKVLEIASARTVNPFNLYLKENYKSIVVNNPNATYKEIFGIIANSWRSMPLEQKGKYFDKANENRRLKKVELEKFYMNIGEKETKNVIQSLRKIRSDRRKKLSKFRIKREKKSLNRPKAPPGTFFLYVKTLDRGEASIQEFIKGASMKWKALAQEDKQKFIDQNKALVEEYKKKLDEWETRMVADGHLNLVRTAFRRKLEHKLKPKKQAAAKPRGAKGARALRLRKAKKANYLKKWREKRAKKKELAQKKLVRAEVAKAKRLVDLASKLNLKIIKKSLPKKKKVETAKKTNAIEHAEHKKEIVAEIGVNKQSN